MLHQVFAVSSLLVWATTALHDKQDSLPPKMEVALGQDVIEVPADLSMDHVALKVSVGEEDPVFFNLDTYAVTTLCVDKVYAEEMKFEVIGEVRNGDGSGKLTSLDLVLVPELRVGAATFTNVPALVDDYSWVTSPDGKPVKGLLGYHLFRDLLLELDYPGNCVRFSRGALKKGDEHVISHGALKTQPDIPLRFGGERIVMGIDSGAQSGLSLPAAWLETLEFEGPPKVVGVAQTVYSKEEILAGTLADPFELCGHILNGEQATFSKIFGRPLIGHGILKKFRVTFDQENGRVRFLLPEAKAVAGER